MTEPDNSTTPEQEQDEQPPVEEPLDPAALADAVIAMRGY